jgi:vacuolar-type H+-ATPase subunit H
MADQILNAVIQLENQLERQLQYEQDRADAWLTNVRHELEREVSQGQAKLAAKHQRVIAKSKKRSERQAEQLLAREMAYCKRLEEISEETLLEVLRRQLVKILPRQVDDHQDGQN